MFITPMSPCEQIIALLDEVTERRAPLRRRLAVKMHLRMCPNCWNYYQQYLAVKRAMNEVTPEHLPPDFDKVLNPVLEKLAARKGQTR